MKKHIQLLGIFFIVYNGLSLLIGIGLFFLLSAIGTISGNETALGILAFIGFMLGALFSVLAVPGIIAGIGLINLRSWARILAIIMACFHVFSIPVGTALTVYTFWVLLKDEAIKEFSHPS